MNAIQSSSEGKVDREISRFLKNSYLFLVAGEGGLAGRSSGGSDGS